MEFAAGGDLGTRIKAMKLAGTVFTEAQVSRWFVQILLGLSFMHSKNIMHRDLKPHNIFLSSEGDKALIGDFGVCRVLESKHELAQTITGTPYYLSPEVFQRKPYSFKSDIWALGCILFELASLSVPFDAIDVAGLSVKVCRGSNPTFPSRYSSQLRELFQSLMQRDHRSRPSADELLARPFVSSAVNGLIKESPISHSDCFTTAASSARSPSPTFRRRMSGSPGGLPPIPQPTQHSPSSLRSPSPRDVRTRSPDARNQVTNQRPSIRANSPRGQITPSKQERYVSPVRMGSARLATAPRRPQASATRSPSPRISQTRPHSYQPPASRIVSPRMPLQRSPSPVPLVTRSSSARISSSGPLKEYNSIHAVRDRITPRKQIAPTRIYPSSPQRQRVPIL